MALVLVVEEALLDGELLEVVGLAGAVSVHPLAKQNKIKAFLKKYFKVRHRPDLALPYPQLVNVAPRLGDLRVRVGALEPPQRRLGRGEVLGGDDGVLLGEGGAPPPPPPLPAARHRLHQHGQLVRDVAVVGVDEAGDDHGLGGGLQHEGAHWN